MKTKMFYIAAIAVAALALGSCDKKDDNNTPVGGTFTSGTWTNPDLRTSSALKITGAVSLDPSVKYNLSGPLLVEAGGSLTIPAGTVIEGSVGFYSYILVLQDGMINVNGTATNPVEMKASATGDKVWGGLVINGRAPLTSGTTTAKTEINNDYSYGGTSATDNSGSIQYLILRDTGAKSSADVEHNGLTLNGVGSGTTIHDIFVIDGHDDGIEFFGGSVNVSNLLVVNSDDDMFDFTQGYNGTLKNAYGIWESGFSTVESDASGVEADGNFDGNFASHTNQSNFKIENMTIDLRLAHATDINHSMLRGINIRRGAKATITNALIKGSGYVATLVNMNDSKGGGDVATSISLTNELSNAPGTLFKGQGSLMQTDYPAINVAATGNTGCLTNTFSWTGYAF